MIAIAFLGGLVLGVCGGAVVIDLCRAADDARDFQQTALEVLCRVFDDGADVAHDEWLTWYKSSEWLHPSRALGAFIRLRLERRLPREVMG